MRQRYIHIGSPYRPRPNSLAAYLGRIVRNLSINRWNKNHAQKRFGGTEVLLSELSQCAPSREDVEGEIQSREITKVLNNWLRSLSQGDRVLFLRRYWFCETLNALAREWGTTPNKLAGRMYRQGRASDRTGKGGYLAMKGRGSLMPLQK